MFFRFAKRMERLKMSAIRELLKLTERPEVISFAGGLPAPELFPVTEFADACAEVLRDDGAGALQYSTTEGFVPLRRWLAEHLHATVGLETPWERILIVSGSQQGLDVVCKALLDPGDFVVIENPSYLGAIQNFDGYEAAYLDVETDEHGMIPDDLARVLATAPRKPKLIYIVGNFANPTGVTTSLERRRAIVELAREHGVPILEDDPYGRLRYSGKAEPSISALAGMEAASSLRGHGEQDDRAGHARRLARPARARALREGRDGEASHRPAHLIVRAARDLRVRSTARAPRGAHRRDDPGLSRTARRDGRRVSRDAPRGMGVGLPRRRALPPGCAHR